MRAAMSRCKELLRKGLLLMTALLMACSTFDTRSAALRSLQAHLHCQEVEAEPRSEFQYDGQGCGRRALAVCTSAALEPSCEVFDRNASSPSTVAPAALECGAQQNAVRRRAATLRLCVGDARAVVVVVRAGAIDCRGVTSDSAECNCIRAALENSLSASCEFLFPVP